jgi:alkanesulfonate monooxygenase SsuD/methylene tetrahydromethanopterin reductase-like flavin-dependent oxidoreductase (luciferase family)
MSVVLPVVRGDMTLGVALSATGAGNQIDATVELAAQAAGRPAPRIVALVYGVVTDDVEAVREKAVEQLSFYEQFPSYARAIELSGGSRAADVAVIGDEATVAAEVRRYRDAGATEVVFSGTDIAGDADRRRTWALLGQLAA